MVIRFNGSYTKLNHKVVCLLIVYVNDYNEIYIILPVDLYYILFITLNLDYVLSITRSALLVIYNSKF